uniref:Pre-mRNA cleavage complex 2 protein Pcf11 n=1 Tax=Cyclopterus lumpus TaxID=8103 RepID=A0A8C2XEA6_CYCLU
MADEAACEDACREYQSSLEDLTFNSKPHINMLTILAEENLNFAKDIVAIIEAQISKAPSAEKLPVLYLVDSIVKNVGGEYLAVFAKNLITSFICVFEKVDENTRKSLFKLRSTWDDVFPLKKLYGLDARVNSVDPAWPIKPLPPTVNASIHVNPKFLKQVCMCNGPLIISPQSSLTQEQLIRQQLLAKQKQLLELQQKKIELELQQTNEQLGGGFGIPTATRVSSAAKFSGQTSPAVRSWIAPSTPAADAKPPTRDPRLNRAGPPHKELHAGKKDGTVATGGPAVTPEKSGRPDRVKTPRKEAPEEKPKSKPPSPMTKGLQSKNKMEAEIQKSADGTKKDPRLKKRPQDKTGDAKEEELKEKKRCAEKKEEVSRGPDPQRANKVKLVNGSVGKHDRAESAEKPEFKTGGNARTHARKRTRSRKDRRSPKSRTRSSSSSPSPSHKAGKLRRVGPDHGKPGRGDRPAAKKNPSESRRSKRPAEDRHAESRDPPRSHDGGGKEAKEPPHRWRSGWEENKHPKLPEDAHVKPAPQRHKQYGPPNRPPTPRTPKHRLSVDANLKIPEVLNSASKKDLLRRASKGLESGDISQEDFLNMAHKIKHFFQYQEEMQQRSDGWTDDDFSAKKLLSSPPPARDGMDAAELSYYEHKSKLRKTQVTHRSAGEPWEGEESPEEGEDDPKSGYDAPRGYGAPPADARRPEAPPPGGTVVHRNCPSPDAVAAAAAPRFERERLSPLHQKDPAEMSPIPRFESPNSVHSDDGPLNLDLAAPPTTPKSILKPPARVGPLAAVRRADSPGHTPPHDGGPPPPRYDMGPGRPHPPGWYENAAHYDDARFEGPHHPGHVGPGRPHHNMPERFDGPHMPHGLGRYPQGPGRFEGPGPGHFEGPMQHFDAPRCFENNMAPGSGPMGFQQQRPMRFDGPPNPMGPMRFEGGGPMRFESPNHPGPHQGGPPLYEGPLRFGPQHNLQPMAPPLYDGPIAPQQSFNMNPQFPAGPMAFPTQPAGSFNMQPAPPFSQPETRGVMWSSWSSWSETFCGGLQVNMLGNLNQPFLPQNSVPFGQQAPPENHFGQVDVNDLLSKLISNGIIKPSQPDAAPAVSAGQWRRLVHRDRDEEEELEEEDDDLPDLTSFTVDDMKQRFESVVTRLYSGNQCCLCSMRFTATQTDLYADHLDWHFRQNHAGKVAGKKITHRRWYYGLRDWVEFEEIADLEERAKSNFFEKESEDEVQKSQQAAKEKEFQSVRATKDQVGELCEICQEAFETYWVEEEEDWFLKDALRVDDKNFHPACFEDYKNTSSYLDVTPSPSKLLADHPLSAFIKSEEDDEEEEEEEEEASASCAAAVKQEVESGASELPEVKKEQEEVLMDCDQSKAPPPL